MKCHPFPTAAAEKRLAQIVNRGLRIRKKDLAAVRRILDDVRKNGDRAVFSYTRRFDAPDVEIESLRVAPEAFAGLRRRIDPRFLKSLKQAKTQIEAFHVKQRSHSFVHADRDGTLLGQLVRPVEKAGVYVPGGAGGKTPLVSSVLMGAIPAKIAGVAEVVMVTPPRADGSVNPHLLAAAEIVGVDAVYIAGSAWGIAALAFGTETIPKVDVIVGPGNIYVTAAKKLLAGEVGIDMIAGPSEILILADHTADPDFIAADLLSQAEHDILASAMLITDSQEVAERVSRAVAVRLKGLTRKAIAHQSIKRFGLILVVPDLDTAFEIANRIAPEHLELMIEDPLTHLSRVRHAGAVFLGPYSPEPLGDYIAGPNHVLPTAGTARFASALSVEHFLKKTSLIYYSQEAFLKEAQSVIRLADIEGLSAHAGSVHVRLAALKKSG
jgi:histidinol dehydrogenase